MIRSSSPRSTVPVLLAFPLLASLAMAQRSVPVPAPVAGQDPSIKLPAPPPPVQAPMTRIAKPSNYVVPEIPKARNTGANPSAGRLPRDTVYYSTGVDGSPQARGRSYKALFTSEGATYVPFCGPQAPQNHPVGFQLASINSGGSPLAFSADAAAVRNGSSVSYARGSVTEVYDLAVDSVEQKFVFSSLPGAGDLAVRLDLATEMSAGWDGNSIVFTSPDGSVRYGAATVVDANGAQSPAPTELVAGGIEIRVPADFLATAAFPVTIDPVITTFNVNWGITFDDFAPAVAWDETNLRYCTVCEETFSATDHDVIFVFSDNAGAFLQGGYVDTSVDYWATPDVANNNYSNNFYAVGSVGVPGGGLRTVRGRTIDAASGTVGTDTEVSVGTFGEDINPSVGGDPFFGTAAYFTVVWERVFSPGSDHDVWGQQVDQAGALLGALINIDNSISLDTNPRISKSCLGAGIHHVVWQRHISSTDADIYAAEVSWAGTINIPSTVLITGGNTPNPACSPIDNANNWLLVYEYDYGDHDIVAAHMSGLTINTQVNVSWREYDMGGGLLFQNQVNPAADTDGVHFAVSYSEQWSSSTTDYDMYLSSVDKVGAYLMVGEFHQNVAFDTSHEDFPRMCSQQTNGGSGNRMCVNWSDDTNGGANAHDVEAAVYAASDFTKLCFANFDGVNACPCSNNPSIGGLGCNNSSATGGASLNGSGNASIGADTAVFSTFGEKPTATSILAQGSAQLAAGLSFGQGLRCAGGTLKRLYTKTAVGGSITAPGGGDPSVHTRSAALGDPLAAGSVRYYYVYYRDPTVLGGCSATATFNATDTVQVIWRP